MSSLGPTIIFDKSVLQSLNEDEAVWLDALYHSVITPLFYIETLADLDKVSEVRTAEQIVGSIANKVPEMSSSPTVHHRELALSNLFGVNIQLSRKPFLGGGRDFITNGKKGIIFNEQPETIAFSRWQKHEFLEIEKDIASLWRKELTVFDYEYFSETVKEIVGKDFKQPKSFQDAYEMSCSIINGCGDRYKTLKLLRDLLQINDKAFKIIIDLWNKDGMSPVNVFAPYAGYILKIDIFFILCTNTGLISKHRKSNRADVAYLYYLPFTNIFTSGDKLHKNIIPFFIEPDQRFVWGPELKEDLRKLDEYYSKKSEKEKQDSGAFGMAWYPPDNNLFLTTRLWDDLRPDWRMDPSTGVKMNTKVPESLKKHIKEAYDILKNQPISESQSKTSLDDANDIILRKVVRGRRGNWQLFSNDVINSKNRIIENNDESDETII